MPDSTEAFKINNCRVTPRGQSAQMSRSGTNQPNQGIWINNDNQYSYTVTLSPDAWQLKPGQPGCPDSLSFTIAKGDVSCIYLLKSDAPLGPNSYTVARNGTDCKELTGDPTDPDVIINS